MGRAATARKDDVHQDTGRRDPVELPSKAILQLNTLKGDIAKLLLDEMKLLQKPWQKMNETEQQRLITRCADVAANVIHNTTTIVASRGFAYIECSVGKVSVDKGIEMKVVAPFDKNTIGDICSRRNEGWMLIPRDMHAFLGGKLPKPDVVGDLAMPKGSTPKEAEPPKTGPGSPSDEKAIAQLGRGKGDGTVHPEAVAALNDAEKALADFKRQHHTGDPSNEQQKPAGEGDATSTSPENGTEAFDPTSGELAHTPSPGTVPPAVPPGSSEQTAPDKPN